MKISSALNSARLQGADRVSRSSARTQGLALDNTTIGILEGLTSQEAVTQATFPVVDGKLETVIDRVVKEVPKLQDRDTSMVPTRRCCAVSRTGVS